MHRTTQGGSPTVMTIISAHPQLSGHCPISARSAKSRLDDFEFPPARAARGPDDVFVSKAVFQDGFPADVIKRNLGTGGYFFGDLLEHSVRPRIGSLARFFGAEAFRNLIS
jgi:hypothetical protein